MMLRNHFNHNIVVLFYFFSSQNQIEEQSRQKKKQFNKERRNIHCDQDENLVIPLSLIVYENLSSSKRRRKR